MIGVNNYIAKVVGIFVAFFERLFVAFLLMPRSDVDIGT